MSLEDKAFSVKRTTGKSLRKGLVVWLEDAQPLEKKLQEWERDWKWHLKNDCTPKIVVEGLEKDKKDLEARLAGCAKALEICEKRRLIEK